MSALERPRRHGLAVAVIELALLAMPLVLIDRDHGHDGYALPKEWVLHVAAVVVGFSVFGAPRRRRWDLVDLALGGLFALGALAALNATLRDGAVGWWALRALGLSASVSVLFAATRTLAADHRSRDRLLAALALAALLAAGLAVAEAYGVLPRLSMLGRGPAAGMGNRNFLAHFLVLVIPVLVLQAAPLAGLRAILSAAALVLVGAALAISRCRAAWLALLPLAAVGLVFGVRLARSTGFRVRGLVLALLLVLGFGLPWLLPPNPARAPSVSVTDTASRLLEHEAGSGRGRLLQYASTVRMISVHPALGVGPGNWSLRYPEYVEPADPSWSPNELSSVNRLPSQDVLGFAAERGLPAALLAAALLLWCGARLLKDSWQLDRSRAGVSAAAIAALAAWLVLGNLDAVLLREEPALLLAVLVGLALPRSGSQRAPLPSRVRLPARGFAALLALAVTGYAGARCATVILTRSPDLARWELAARLDPGNPVLLTALARAARQSGDCVRASSWAERALAVLPGSAPARWVLDACRPGRALVEVGNIRPANGSREHGIRSQIAREEELPIELSSTPDGSLHALVLQDRGRVALVDLREAPRVELLALPDAWPSSVILSPRGRFLLYTYSDSLEWEAEPGQKSQDLVLFDRVTRERRTLVDRRQRLDGRLSHISWSPDERFVLFSRTWQAGPEQNREIVRVEVASGEERILVPAAYPRPTAPAWSPDGSTLSYYLAGEVWLANADGSHARQLTRLGNRDAELAPSTWSPDAPAWSRDGRRLAFSVAVRDCFRIVEVDVASGQHTFPWPNECGFRPTFGPRGELAYLELAPRHTEWTPRLREPDGQRKPLGFREGMTYRVAFGAHGRVLLIGQDRTQSRTVALLEEGAVAPRALLASVEPALPAGASSRPEVHEIRSADGLRMPLIVWPRTCTRSGATGPAVLMVHGGPNLSYSPRFWREAQLFAAAGATVTAVNYRGSTGSGRAFEALKGDRAGQVADLRAAIDYTSRLPGVDGRVVLLVESFASIISYELLSAPPKELAGWMEWFGDAPFARPPLPPSGFPMFFTVGTFDPRRELGLHRAQWFANAGAEVVLREYRLSHDLRVRAERARFLEDSARHFIETFGTRCE